MFVFFIVVNFFQKGLSVVPSILLQSTGSGKRITHLDLSHNQIGLIPTELCQLENLSHLILSHNKLSELPSDVSRLRNITFLDVSHNFVSYLPTELGMLSRLSHLIVSNNALQSLVAELFHGAAPICGSMRELDLSFNHLSSLPATLSNLRLLQSLNLSNNQISDVFAGLSRMLANGLRVCNLSHNVLQTLPPPFSEHRKIINIAHNPFVQFPVEVVGRGTTAVWDYLEGQKKLLVCLFFISFSCRHVAWSANLPANEADVRRPRKRRQDDAAQSSDWES